MKKYLAFIVLMVSPIAHADVVLSTAAPMTVNVTGADGTTLSAYFGVNQAVAFFDCQKGPSFFDPPHCQIGQTTINNKDQAKPVASILTKSKQAIHTVPGVNGDVSMKTGTCSAKDNCTLTFQILGGVH